MSSLHAISIQKVPESFRDEGVPRSARIGQLACDATFNRYASQWLLQESSLDSAYAAIEALAQLPGTAAGQFLERHEEEFSSLLARHFDRGVFRADGTRRTRGVFACHAAIGVMKSLANLHSRPFIQGGRPGQALTHGRYDDMVCSLPGVGRLDLPPHEHVLRLIEESAAASPIRGALLDHPASRLPPTLTVLYTAANVVWNLFPDDAVDRFFGLVDEHGCRRFLEGCLRQDTRDSVDLAGFTVHPASEELCTNTTFFGLKLLDRLGLRELTLDSGIHRGITAFLVSFAYKDGGFTSTLQEGPSLNATFLSLRALEMLLPEEEFLAFVRAEARRIQDFVDRCSNPVNGGARFAPDDRRFVENCLATRYRLQIVDLLARTNGESVPEELIADTHRFLMACYDPRSGGFLAYAPGRLKVDVDDPRGWLEAYLDERDEVLRAALTRPELEREIEIDRAYRELEELCLQRSDEGEIPDLEQQVSVVEARLRDLQAEEAQDLRRRAAWILADLGIDLEGSESRLAEVRALRARYGNPATADPAP